MAAIFALSAAALFGAADFTGGQAARRAPVLAVTLVTNLVGVALALGLVLAFGGAFSTASIGWGSAAGVAGLAGIVLLYRGLAVGPNRLVSPLSAVVAALIPVTVGIATGDRPGTVGIVGLTLALPAIWLVAGGDLRVESSRQSAIGMGLGAGAGFGVFFTLLAQSPDDAGAVPLLAARVTSTVVLVMVAAARGEGRPRVTSSTLPALAGVLDMSANGLFLWATRDGELAVVGALVNLFPVTTILLAIAVLGERLGRPQAVGLALAVTSAALLS